MNFYYLKIYWKNKSKPRREEKKSTQEWEVDNLENINMMKKIMVTRSLYWFDWLTLYQCMVVEKWIVTFKTPKPYLLGSMSSPTHLCCFHQVQHFYTWYLGMICVGSVVIKWGQSCSEITYPHALSSQALSCRWK